MEISVSEAKAVLTELVRRAENGEEVNLMRHGETVARIVPKRAKLGGDDFDRLLTELQAIATTVRDPGWGATADAARSQDFLYDENGLPG
jgi:prevent-host-death family protein